MKIRCKRCNRVIKDEQSVSLGYGRSCYQLMFGKKPPTTKKQYKPENITKYGEPVGEIPPLYIYLEELKEKEEQANDVGLIEPDGS